MKKILLTSSVAALLLQGAVTANAGFSVKDLHGYYAYSLYGHTGELSGEVWSQFVEPVASQTIAVAPTTSTPNYISEVGVFKADGMGHISSFNGSTFLTENLVNTTGLPTFTTSI